MPTVAALVAAIRAMSRYLAKALPLTVSSRAHTTDGNSVEQDLSMQDMAESGVRRRLAQDQSPGTVLERGDSLSDGSEALTPTSSDEAHQDEASRAESLTRARWHRLLAKLAPALRFHSTTEDDPQMYPEHSYERFQYDKVDEYPIGIPQLASFLNSNDDFAIFRGFGQSHSRILLHLMVEITKIEEELLELDKADAANEAMHYRLQRTKHKEGWDIAQVELLQRLREKIKEYDDFLLKYANIRALGRPPARNHQSVFHWVVNHGPLAIGYDGFIYKAEDFVSMPKWAEQRSGSNYFEAMILSHVKRWPKTPLKGLLKTDAELRKTEDQHVNHYSSTNISTGGIVLMDILAISILLLPVFLLFLGNMTRPEMAAVVLVFVVAFCVVISIVTEARVQEVFVLTIAYAAVLVTFLGNLSSGNAVSH